MSEAESQADGSEDAAAYWEARYGEKEQIWSGEPNAALVSTVGDLPAGSALDLGCGEGADAVWLAERGWAVTAVDISATAIARGQAVATRRGLTEDRITWRVEDLSSWQPTGAFDLVSACFLHSHDVVFPRTEVLRRAAASVAPGGHLLVVGHAEPPPWANWHEHEEDARGGEGHHGHHDLLGPDEELAALDLDSDGWTVVVSEVRTREAVGPDGEPAMLQDAVVLLRR